jgi:hypothetical protein
VNIYALEWNTRSRKVAAVNGFLDGDTIDSEEGRFLVPLVAEAVGTSVGARLTWRWRGRLSGPEAGGGRLEQ